MSDTPPAVQAVRRYLDALAGDDPDAIAELVTNDFENRHLAVLGDNSTGAAEYRSRLPGFLREFPDRKYRIIDAAHERRHGSDVVVVHYAFEAHPEGHELTVPGLAWFVVREGKIAHRTDSWDSLTVLRQASRDEA